MSEAASDIDRGTTLAAGSGAHELGLVGRVAVIGIVLAGALVAVQSWIGLVMFIPFAGMGALLAIRRPRVSIGWILLAVGWVMATLSIQVDATVAQFTDATVSWPLRLFALVHGAAPSLMFLLLALLALVFPSGRLPVGRLGTAVRVALVIGLLLVLATPIMGYATIYPIMILALGAVISLGVRYRRAQDVERQQLRWLVAALTFLTLAVLVGFGISYLVPGFADYGLAWSLAIVAFLCIPISIGIAVLRYRLYEIDTIINRAIVYGLLTAIVAGIYAASIALMQRLFVTLTGEGSDAAIVLTTLVVVVAFTPIKNRLQAIADRRFKEVRDPASDLDAFVAEVQHALSPPDRDRALRRLLEVAVEAYGADGGEVKVSLAKQPMPPITVGRVQGQPSHRASTTAGDLRAEVIVVGADPSRDYKALDQAFATVVDEVGQTGTSDDPNALGG